MDLTRLRILNHTRIARGLLANLFGGDKAVVQIHLALFPLSLSFRYR